MIAQSVLLGMLLINSNQGMQEQWIKDNLTHPLPPFSFVYDGVKSTDLLDKWQFSEKSFEQDKNRLCRELTWIDPKTKLSIRCAAVEYRDFPTVEWTVYFKNNGSEDTPIISEIKGLDGYFRQADKSDFVLHHNKGTFVKADDFEPLESVLEAGKPLTFTPSDGRPCGAVWPYFNLCWKDGGVIIAVGWPGKWSATFSPGRDGVAGITAGQELTHLKLHPGEEIRTPLMVLQFHNGDWTGSQNIWRRWMMAHNMPKPHGKLPPTQFVACSSHQFAEMINANEENQKFFVDRYLEEGLQLDYWWMDAGWYVNNGNWPNTGTWEVDTKRFPRGLRNISDHARKKAVKTIVWFEPERVNENTWLWNNHPEWLLDKEGSNKLLNLGNPEALKWLTEHVDKILNEQGIDLYRQDYNINPLPFWRGSDAEDRQGITENHYVSGYLAYWDELLRRHPNMLIDTCASGGHRNDLETLRRSVPLLRSDYIMEPVGQQGHTYGLAFWVPYFGTGTRHDNIYDLRSTFCSSFNACWDMRNKDLDYDLLRRMITEWREYAPNFYGDFYPLTPYSLDSDKWMAWQFDRPESGQGMVQAFRRADCAEDSINLKLHSLDPNAAYIIKNFDAKEEIKLTGKQLMEDGLTLPIQEKPGAAVLLYRKI